MIMMEGMPLDFGSLQQQWLRNNPHNFEEAYNPQRFFPHPPHPLSNSGMFEPPIAANCYGGAPFFQTNHHHPGHPQPPPPHSHGPDVPMLIRSFCDMNIPTNRTWEPISTAVLQFGPALVSSNPSSQRPSADIVNGFSSNFDINERNQTPSSAPSVMDHRTDSPSSLLLASNTTYADILAEFRSGEADENEDKKKQDKSLAAELSKRFEITPSATQEKRVSMAPEPLNWATIVKRHNTAPVTTVKSEQKEKASSETAATQPSSPKHQSHFVKNKAHHQTIYDNKENQSKTVKTSIVHGVNLNSLKFVKPSPQCPKWDKPKHRIEEPHCPFWHPRVVCHYYPKCQLTAAICGYAHPFCGDICKCDPKNKSIQMNHNIVPGTKPLEPQTKKDVGNNGKPVAQQAASKTPALAQEVAKKSGKNKKKGK